MREDETQNHENDVVVDTGKNSAKATTNKKQQQQQSEKGYDHALTGSGDGKAASGPSHVNLEVGIEREREVDALPERPSRGRHVNKTEDVPHHGVSGSKKAEPSSSGKTHATRQKRNAINEEERQEDEKEKDAYDPLTSDLEKRRMAVAQELFKVEQQIFDLETKYLDQSSAFGNAIKGYEGFLGGAGLGNRKVVIKPEDRLFSMSSIM